MRERERVHGGVNILIILRTTPLNDFIRITLLFKLSSIGVYVICKHKNINCGRDS